MKMTKKIKTFLSTSILGGLLVAAPMPANAFVCATCIAETIAAKIEQLGATEAAKTLILESVTAVKDQVLNMQSLLAMIQTQTGQKLDSTLKAQMRHETDLVSAQMEQELLTWMEQQRLELMKQTAYAQSELFCSIFETQLSIEGVNKKVRDYKRGSAALNREYKGGMPKGANLAVTTSAICEKYATEQDVREGRCKQVRLPETDANSPSPRNLNALFNKEGTWSDDDIDALKLADAKMTNIAPELDKNAAKGERGAEIAFKRDQAEMLQSYLDIERDHQTAEKKGFTQKELGLNDQQFKFLVENVANSGIDVRKDKSGNIILSKQDLDNSILYAYGSSETLAADATGAVIPTETLLKQIKALSAIQARNSVQISELLQRQNRMMAILLNEKGNEKVDEITKGQ